MLSMSTQTMSKTKNNAVSTKRIATIGICAAISFVLMFVKFPVSYLGFLELEISDVPAAIVTLIYGPAAGILVELIKNVLHLTATSTGMSGELSNFLVSIGFILPFGLLTRKNKANKNLILGFAAGTIGMALMGMAVNYFVTVPLYLTLFGRDAVMGMVQATIPSIDNVASLVMIGITPFNIVKGIVISILTYSLYKILRNRI